MTVKELIELLQKEDQDAEVKITYWWDNDSGTSWEVEREVSYLTKYDYTHKNKRRRAVLLHE